MRISQAATAFLCILVSVFSSQTAALAFGPTDFIHIHPGQDVRPPPGWVQFCQQFPKDCDASQTAYHRAALTKEKFRELDIVNRSFNRLISPVTDADQYGVVELWTYAASGKGDCEDYVLEKRRRLIQLGWPRESLLVTVVINKQNEGHAVLTVVTDRGDLVLDNLNDEILPWSQTGLVFIKRQATSEQNRWIDLGGVLGLPETITAGTRR